MVPWGLHILYAQEPELVWAKSFGGSHNESQNDRAVDKQGNFYVIGGFMSEEIDFGSFILTTEYHSHYLVKFNSDGEAIWGKVLGIWIPYSSIYTYSVAVDSW